MTFIDNHKNSLQGAEIKIQELKPIGLAPAWTLHRTVGDAAYYPTWTYRIKDKMEGLSSNGILLYLPVFQ